MYAHGFPQGTPHSLIDIQAAAQLMYYGGDLAAILLIIAFFAVWFRKPPSELFRAIPAHSR
jgi:putative membrane protein